MDVMDASGSTGNDVSTGKDVNLHKVRICCAAQLCSCITVPHILRLHFELGRGAQVLLCAGAVACAVLRSQLTSAEYQRAS